MQQVKECDGKKLKPTFAADPIEEYSVQHLKEFDGKKLKSTSAAVSSSPFLEALLKKSTEVLYMVELINFKDSQVAPAELEALLWFRRLQEGVLDVLGMKMASLISELKDLAGFLKALGRNISELNEVSQV